MHTPVRLCGDAYLHHSAQQVLTQRLQLAIDDSQRPRPRKRSLAGYGRLQPPRLHRPVIAAAAQGCQQRAGLGCGGCHQRRGRQVLYV